MLLPKILLFVLPMILAPASSTAICANQLTLPLVEFMSGTLPTNKPQSSAQVEIGLEQGRPAPPIELLQPILDASLSSYVPIKESLAGNYTFAASDILAVLSKNWVSAFMEIYPMVNMSVPAPYAGSLGALELIKGTLRGVFVSRELKPSDVSAFTDAFGYPPTSVPISGGSYRQYGFLDAVAFVVNKENPIEHLSFDQLDSILSTTHARGGKNITKWGDVGVTGRLANMKIKIYGLQPWNGFEEFVRQRVLNYNGTRGQYATIFNMTKHVANDPAGLAYTGLAYVDSPVRVIGLSNHTGDAPIAPTYENIALATWPLARVTYFNSNHKPNTTMDPVLKELQKFIVSKEGQQIVKDQGLYMPFRAEQQLNSLKMLG